MEKRSRWRSGRGERELGITRCMSGLCCTVINQKMLSTMVMRGFGLGVVASLSGVHLVHAENRPSRNLLKIW